MEKIINNPDEFSPEQVAALKKAIENVSLGVESIWLDEEFIGNDEFPWIYKNENIYFYDSKTETQLIVNEDDLPLDSPKCFFYGTYGRYHEEYLKSEHPDLYEEMKREHILYKHLAVLDTLANVREDKLIETMSKSEGITEKLKMEDMFEWVRRIKNLQNRVREIVCSEMIYTI